MNMPQLPLFLLGLIPLALVVILVNCRGRRLVGQLPNASKAEEFKKNLWKKHFNLAYPGLPEQENPPSDSRQQSDRLLSYLERVVDRTINKARGVLPFNSLIMAVLSIEKSRLDIVFSMTNLWNSWTIVYFYAVIIGLAVSSYKCLELFLVRFGPIEIYGKIKEEVDGTVDVIMSRSVTLEWAVSISEASLWSGIVIVIGAEFLLGRGLLQLAH
jgi:hypothetical protein